jgi:hypothetical protein
MTRAQRFFLGLSFVAVAGCGNVDDQTDVTESVSTLGSGEQCHSITPDIYQSGRFEYTSPRTYDRVGCRWGFIVEARNYIYVSSDLDDLRVTWADTAPTTQASCEAAWGQALLYEGSTLLASKSAFGIWDTSPQYPARCSGPSMSFPRSLLQQGHNYRVAATMRTAKASGAPTRKVKIAQVYLLR